MMMRLFFGLQSTKMRILPAMMALHLRNMLHVSRYSWSSVMTLPTLQPLQTLYTQVIAHLAGHHGQFKLPVYKPLRENMRPLVSLESGRNFAGFNLDEYKDAKTRFANPLSLSNAFERDVAGF
eukprot:m.85416 g.85416  ORF g.85416 m.85416 type:complete len:123 (+) comp14724_c0_seq4:83-451(+)